MWIRGRRPGRKYPPTLSFKTKLTWLSSLQSSKELKSWLETTVPMRISWQLTALSSTTPRLTFDSRSSIRITSGIISTMCLAFITIAKRPKALLKSWKSFMRTSWRRMTGPKSNPKKKRTCSTTIRKFSKRPPLKPSFSSLRTRRRNAFWLRISSSNLSKELEWVKDNYSSKIKKE